MLSGIAADAVDRCVDRLALQVYGYAATSNPFNVVADKGGAVTDSLSVMAAATLFTVVAGLLLT